MLQQGILPIGEFISLLFIICLVVLIDVYWCCFRQSAKFVTEAAMALVQDASQLPPVYGVVTPAVGLGSIYRKRLTDKGASFQFEL